MKKPSNLFDQANFANSFSEENIKKKILSVEEPLLYTYMTKQQQQEAKEKITQVKGDGSIESDGKTVSVYGSDTQKVFDTLNKISPSMCLAKWYNVSIHIPTGKTHSCYHPPAHRIPLEEIRINSDAIHNTKYKKEQRKKMLQGERPQECNFCWDIEDSGNMLSDRAYRSKDVYKPGILKELAQDGYTGNPTPRYVEVNFNQACNFKCAYCSPHLSTEWHKEINQHGPYIMSDGRTHNDVEWMKRDRMMPDNSPDNPYLKAFWEWFPKIYPTLQTFRMTGGEPLMDKNTFKVFDYVNANPKGRDLHLSITSNCCPPGNQWKKFIKSLNELEKNDAIDHFMLYCSLDSWGPQAEYIRTGLHFDTMYQNITEYLRKGRKHSLTFIVTFNALSIPGWMSYVKNILKLRQEFNTTRQLIWFDVPMLMEPNWLNLKLLPAQHLKMLEKSIKFMKDNIETSDNPFKGFKDYEIDKVQRLYDWAIQPWSEEELVKHRADFYAFYTQHDQRRNTDFVTTFPELKSFANIAKKSYNKVKK